MKKHKEPLTLTIHIVPSKKLTPKMKALDVYNKMLAEKAFKGAKAWIDFWRGKVERQDMIKELLNEEVVSRKKNNKKQSRNKKRKV